MSLLCLPDPLCRLLDCSLWCWAQIPLPLHAVIVPWLRKTPSPALTNAYLRSFCKGERALGSWAAGRGSLRNWASAASVRGDAQESFSAWMRVADTPFLSMRHSGDIPGEMVASRLIFLRWNLHLWSEQHRSGAGKCLPGMGQGEQSLPWGCGRARVTPERLYPGPHRLLGVNLYSVVFVCVVLFYSCVIPSTMKSCSLGFLSANNTTQ